MVLSYKHSQNRFSMFLWLVLTSIQIQAFFSMRVSHGDITQNRSNIVSITFDDGPHKQHTTEVLDILREKHVPATFFVIGNRIAWNEDILRKIIKEGHIIGNHSYSHPILKKLPTFQLGKQIIWTQIRLFLTTGIFPQYFRFPYGVEDYRVWYFHLGPIIGWNVDAYDWKAKNPKILAQNIIRQTKSGSIILLHDIKSDTVAALPDIIDGIRAKGYRIVSLKELLPISPLSRTRNRVYRSQNDTIHISQKKPWPLMPTTESIILAGQPHIITEIGTW